MKTLVNKIFTTFVTVLLLVQIVSFGFAYQANKRVEVLKLTNQITTADTVFKNLFESRNYYLEAFSETAAKDYGLKQVFNEDTRSFLVALNNHKKRIDADIAIAVSKQYQVVGQLLSIERNGKKKTSVGEDQGKEFRHPEWLELPGQSYIYHLNEALYQISFSPLKSGEVIVGWVGFGYAIDKSLVEEISMQTGLHAAIVSKKNTSANWHLVASSEQQTETESLINSLLSNSNNEEMVITKHTIEDNGYQVIAVMYDFRSDILGTVKNQSMNLMLFASISILASMLGAFFIAKTITRPVNKLIEQTRVISKGNYDQSVEIDDIKELAQLASEFKMMQQAVLAREKDISHRVFHDPLTDLPNRNRLMYFLEIQLQEKEPRLALALLNVRRIRDVNDTLGHNVGDQVIKEVSRRLTKLNNENVFHLGSDEFALVWLDNNDDFIQDQIKRIFGVLDKPFTYHDIALHLQVQIGVAFNNPDNETAINLLQKTDTALHNARKSNHHYQIYDRLLDFYTIERLHLVNSLKSAFTENQLVLYYQPKLDLRASKITSVEALVRWLHPVNGLIPPDTFIPIAEQTGQMNALTKWVIEEAANQYTKWQKDDINLSIAINISAEDLRNDELITFLLALKNAKKLPDEAIALEVTENAVLSDPKLAIKLLARLQKSGFRISIDDYGTGYSSLEQLKILPVDELKIDKSFVQNLMMDKDDQTIVDSTISLAHNMNLSVVAEGVEDLETLAWLQARHCQYAQGYYVSRPLPAEKLTSWLPSFEGLKIKEKCHD
ncbi:bifunctional diguanylate cyclase/phosphodiesterase [Aliikangiella coralliicola]|uniref:cyclic-guanylate-specific phosphodiesterase n=1 Tax=Aliikangiella coralliicola TaxID=2592383 RepID=A0A545UAC0_9GAMM|nr:EAL domain-containing protein [Aliikangiella coralliicola]TQV86417.1 EAL domain-containing protein [Aliikangiella coralliicola]